MPVEEIENRTRSDASAEGKRLLLISLIFILIRLVILQQYIDSNPFFRHPVIDSRMYLDWAESILNEKAYFLQEYHHPPGYAVFLAAILLVSGFNLYAVLILQVLMVAAQAALIFYIGRRLFGTKAAWISFVLYSICGPVLFYSMKVLSETLYTTLILTSFLLLLRYLDSRKYSQILWCGLFLGLAIEVRGNATFLFWPTLAGALITPATWKQRAISAGVLAVGVSVFTVPVLVRNISVAGAWTPVASNWGENFYFGNNPNAIGGVPVVQGIRRNIIDQIPDVQKEASRRVGKKLTSLEAQRFWFQEGVQFIRSNPSDWLNLEWIKIRRTVQRRLPSGIYSYPLETKHYHDYFRFFIGYGLLFPLFFLGILAFPWNVKSVLFLSYLIFQLLLIFLYWPEERYLLPVIPFLISVAGCVALLRQRSAKRIAICFAGLILCGYANISLLPGTGGSEAWYANASAAHFANDELSRAEAMARESIKIDPRHTEAWINLGAALYARGNLAEARKAWLQALSIDSNELVALRNMAISYEGTDRDHSLEWWNRALEAARRNGSDSAVIKSIEQRISELEQKF